MLRAITVTGEVSKDELGITLPHEHFIIDLTTYVDEERFGQTAVQRDKLEEEVSIDNLWWVGHYGRQTEWRSRDRWRLRDVDTAITEVERFRDRGGNTVVDVTPMSPDVGRDPRAVQQIAYSTGLNIIAGTGHYVEAAHPPEMEDLTASEIAEDIILDIEEGMDDTKIRAGIIGEIGATHEFLERENEKKSFRAAAKAQEKTRAPITIHPPVMHQEGHDVLDVLEDAGANLDNVVLGHMDAAIRTDDASEYFDTLAQRGVYIEFDTFGRMGYSADADQCFPLDEDRIIELRKLCDNGYEDQLLISTDICHKVHLTKYAGFGYDYILRDIVPRLRDRDFTEEEINKLLVDNPANAVTIGE
jgi:phosphotriesterase-related protein